MKLAVSTSWARGDETVTDVMARAADLGVTHFELGVLPREKDVEEILGACRSHDWHVVSVHNPVINSHLPRHLMRGDAITSTDEEFRRQGVEDLLRSARIAQEAGASAVVLHAGRIEMNGDRNARLDRIRRAIETGDVKLRRKLIEERLDNAPPNLDRLARSLEEVLAAKPGVTIAVESRYHYDEIPIIDELEWIFRRFDTDKLAYWHDVGHAQMGELLGLAPHRRWLERFSGRLAGVHLHDMIEIHDHRPVGTGNMDFAMVLSHVGQGVLRVIEADETWSPEDLERSARHLAAIGFGEFP